MELLLALLDEEIDEFKPEKKRQILIRLADFKDQRIAERVPECLGNFDEGIRYAAVEALAAQEVDSIRGDLAASLADKEEESNRFRVRIAEVFHRREWDLGEHAEMVEQNPPVGFRIENGRVLPA